MQKLQDFKTILAIHLAILAIIVINLKILENFRSTSIVKLFVCKTVKYEVINVKFLSRDLPLNNSAIMVKWNCLKLLYSSKGTCRIDSQLKKLIHLKYLILEIPYAFFSIFNRYFIALHTLNFLSPMFSGINNKNFSFFGFSNLPVFVFVFKTLKNKIFTIFVALI